jgi:hypothetical protein
MQSVRNVEDDVRTHFVLIYTQYVTSEAYALANGISILIQFLFSRDKMHSKKPALMFSTLLYVYSFSYSPDLFLQEVSFEKVHWMSRKIMYVWLLYCTSRTLLYERIFHSALYIGCDRGSTCKQFRINSCTPVQRLLSHLVYNIAPLVTNLIILLRFGYRPN